MCTNYEAFKTIDKSAYLMYSIFARLNKTLQVLKIGYRKVGKKWHAQLKQR